MTVFFLEFRNEACPLLVRGSALGVAIPRYCARTHPCGTWNPGVGDEVTTGEQSGPHACGNRKVDGVSGSDLALRGEPGRAWLGLGSEPDDQ